MNTRQPSLQITSEDLDIWCKSPMEYSGHRTPGWLRLDCRQSDRRDADIMLAAQVEISLQPFGHPEITFREWGQTIDVAGCFAEWWQLDRAVL